MKDYWQRIGRTLAAFCKPGDEIKCIRLFKLSGQMCQLCEHRPIVWNYVLRNLRTGNDLTVGSRCIHNYKQITEQKVIFPERLQKVADFLIRKWPDCVVVETDNDEWPEHDWVSDEDMELDFDEPDFDDMSADGMDPDEIDWEAEDGEHD